MAAHIETATVGLINTDKMDMVQTKDGYWRFVDHNNRILTTGFLFQDKLMEYRNNFLATQNSIKLATERYKLEYE